MIDDSPAQGRLSDHSLTQPRLADNKCGGLKVSVSDATRPRASEIPVSLAVSLREVDHGPGRERPLTEDER